MILHVGRRPGSSAMWAGLAAIGLTLAASAPASWAEGSGRLGKITLRSTELAFYPRQEMVIRLVLEGGGDNEVVVEPAAFARESFTVRAAAAAPLKLAPAAATGEPPHEAVVVRGFDEVTRDVNLSTWYPDLTKKVGVYEIAWSNADYRAEPIRVAVIPPYKPSKDRVAVVQTEIGTMTWELLHDAAPLHVKNLVDLARLGHYDGLTLFRMVPGVQLEGGDPKGDGTGGWDRVLPPEMAPSLALGFGMVGAARRETSMTSDTVFFITMGPCDYMRGLQTFFARVTKGLDVLAKVSKRPNRGNTGLRDAYLLDDPVTIERITIK